MWKTISTKDVCRENRKNDKNSEEEDIHRQKETEAKAEMTSNKTIDMSFEMFKDAVRNNAGKNDADLKKEFNKVAKELKSTKKEGRVVSSYELFKFEKREEATMIVEENGDFEPSKFVQVNRQLSVMWEEAKMNDADKYVKHGEWYNETLALKQEKDLTKVKPKAAPKKKEKKATVTFQPDSEEEAPQANNNGPTDSEEEVETPPKKDDDDTEEEVEDAVVETDKPAKTATKPAKTASKKKDEKKPVTKKGGKKAPKKVTAKKDDDTEEEVVSDGANDTKGTKVLPEPDFSSGDEN